MIMRTGTKRTGEPLVNLMEDTLQITNFHYNHQSKSITMNEKVFLSYKKLVKNIKPYKFWCRGRQENIKVSNNW